MDTIDSLYEFAQDIFDEEVLDDPLVDYYELFNANKGANEEEALEIVGDMCADAIRAMRECAKEHRDKFIKRLEEQS